MAEQKRLEQNLCWEIGILQQCKHGHTVCGDRVLVSREDDRILLVLSDGLGSGIQANIASTLTATLISGLIKRGFPLEEGIRSVEAVLPVTKKHNLAYATFNLVSTEGRQVRVIQYDSPDAVFLRDGVSLDIPYRQHSLAGKELREAVLTMKSGDMLVLFSDGVSEAGRGVTTYSGWDRRIMEDYLFRSIHPDSTARQVAASILSSVQALDLFEFHDDTTVAVLRLRERLRVNLLIGFPDSRVPVGDAEGITLPVEDDPALREALSVLRRCSQDGMMPLDLGEAEDRVSQLLKTLAEEASDVRIYFRAACGSEQAGNASAAEERLNLVLSLRQCLEKLGKDVTLQIL